MPTIGKFDGQKFKWIKSWSKCFSLTTNKSLEFQFDSDGKFTGLYTSIAYTTKQDHAGFRFEFSTGFINFEFGISDNRHWNYDEDRWYVEGEDQWPEEKTSKYVEMGNFEEVGEVSVYVKGVDKDNKVRKMEEILQEAKLTPIKESEDV